MLGVPCKWQLSIATEALVDEATSQEGGFLRGFYPAQFYLGSPVRAPTFFSGRNRPSSCFFPRYGRRGRLLL